MSALDGRIRTLAREEAAALLGVPSAIPAADESVPTAAQLQQQITDLHEHLHHAATTIKRLEDRLDNLEKTAGHATQEQSLARRTRRKATDE
jgi:phage shock protein A